MSGTRNTNECSNLLALFATSEAAEDDAWVAQAITAHVASCPTCAQAEADLAKLVNHYRRSESSSLPNVTEHRLLEQLCSPSSPASADG